MLLCYEQRAPSNNDQHTPLIRTVGEIRFSYAQNETIFCETVLVRLTSDHTFAYLSLGKIFFSSVYS